MMLLLAALLAQAGASAFGAFGDLGYLRDFDHPTNHLFRSRGSAFHVNEWDVNMAGAYARKGAAPGSRFGAELTLHAGKDTEVFGFSATAPNISGYKWLRHLGPTNVSWLAPAGRGLTLQAGIFGSVIGYDSLYAKDNFSYTRPWGADYTPYLMLGVNASYPLSGKLTATGALVNGYWHLAHANDAPSLAGQLAYKVNDALTLKQTVLAGSHQPDTALRHWRVLSDSILERKSGPFVAALEYQFGTEQVAPTDSRAQWMSAQAIAHVQIQGPWSVTVRPEFAWDRDGRWIGGPQSVTAFTGTLEYRAAARGAQAILRAEYRIDDSRGSSGGFFTDAPTLNSLTPTQNLFIAAAIFTFDGAIRR
jgi:putative OmpL-like beta-barrel porin-2